MKRFLKHETHHCHPLLGLGAVALVGTALAVVKLVRKDKLKAVLRLSCHKAREAKNEALSEVMDAAATVKGKVGSRCSCDCCPCCGKEEPVCFKPGPDAPEEGNKSEETEGLPEPVKAADVVTQHEDSDKEAEEFKNKKLTSSEKTEETPEPADQSDEIPTPAEVKDSIKKPAAPRKPRPPRTPPAEPAE